MANSSKVKFDELGFAHIWVNIPEKDKITGVRLLFKFDTGASCNTIDKEDLYTLGYDDEWIKSGQELTGDFRPTVASGVPLDGCYKIILPEIRFGVFTGRNVRFITGLKGSFKLLLGTSTLQCFNWALDYENGYCSYSKNPKLSCDLFNATDQCFYSVDELDSVK